ncbi:hypothetical protein AB0J63_26815 [Streptosporangium canum]|uniref:hypothetical protein n=1 Tax=Streptosporangium canum TaxID=324952 RepID=UPI0034240B3D
MKRAPLKRGTKGLKRTPLARGESRLSRTTPIRQQSTRRQRENRERRAMVRTLWPDMQPGCVVLDCGRLADDVHEPLTRARGGSITDPANAQPVCRPHHDEITFTEPAWAYEQGLLVHSWDARKEAS